MQNTANGMPRNLFRVVERLGLNRYVPKEKNHGLIDPRCTGICPHGYCGKCISTAPRRGAIRIPKEKGGETRK